MMKLSQWFRSVFSIFIDRDYPVSLLAMLTAILIMMFAPNTVKEKYLDIYMEIPNIAFALMGFVITAAAIIVSIQDKGVLKLLKKHKPKDWIMIKLVFFSTARVLGFLGISVLFIRDSIFLDLNYLNMVWWQVIQVIYLGVTTMIIVYCTIQVIKLIYVLSKLMDLAQEEELAQELESGLNED